MQPRASGLGMNTLASRPPMRLRPPDDWPQPAEERVFAPDIHHILYVLRRRGRVFMAVAGVIFAAALLYTFSKVPLYTATAQVVIDPRKRDVAVVDPSEDRVVGSLDSPALDTEVEVLRSPSLTRSVIEALRLDLDPEFNPPAKPQRAPPAFLAALGAFFTDGKDRVSAPSGRTQIVTGLDSEQARLAVARRVGTALTVTRAGSTYVINVAYSSTDPQKAARIANAYVSQYLDRQLDTKLDATRKANLLFNARLEDLRRQVQEADGAVESYKADNNLLSAGNFTLTEQEAQGLEQRLAEAREEVAAQEARIAIAKERLGRGGTGEDLAEILDSPVVQNLRGQLAEASKKVADLTTTYGSNFPDVQNALQQRAALEGQLRAEISRILSRMQSQARAARANRDALEAEVVKARQTLAVNNQAQVKLRELEQNAEAVRSLYASFLAGAKTTSTAEGLELTDARILSSAEVPGSPSEPRIPLYLALGFVMALLGGAAAVTAVHMLDTTLSTAEDIERKLNVPYLPAIPALSSLFGRIGLTRDSPVEYVVKKPRSALAEAFRALRAALMLSGAHRVPKVIAITSALPGEGKTTTSLCLARILGLAGSRVVLIDCDIRRRHASPKSPMPHAGLVEVLEGRVELDEVLMRDAASGAFFLPIAPSIHEDEDIFSTTATKALLDELRERFDIIILDTPPVLAAADAMVLSSQSDLVVMLARWRKTPSKAVEAAIQSLISVNAVIAGVALTCVDQNKQAHQGYGDPGFYYDSCKKYYRH